LSSKNKLYVYPGKVNQRSTLIARHAKNKKGEVYRRNTSPSALEKFK